MLEVTDRYILITLKTFFIKMPQAFSLIVKTEICYFIIYFLYNFSLAKIIAG